MTIDSLLSRISVSLRALPGAEALYLFGSAADPLRKDPYSDLDLQIITADLALCRASWPWILSGVGEITLVYAFSQSAEAPACCIAFAGESPYHKVDIGLSSSQQKGGFFNKIENKVCLWQQPPQETPPQILPSAALVPEPGTPLYFLIGEMLSSVRYLKARKRGQHLACWRFLRSKFDALLRCYLWNPGDAQFPSAAMITWDYTALDRALPEPDRRLLLETLDCRSPQTMDAALLELTCRIADMIYPAYGSDATPEAHFIREYFAFIQAEIS